MWRLQIVLATLLIAAGFSADIDYCARLDVSSVVPLLQRDADGLLRLRARGG
jgi:phosphosulfolactate phosphohydrolase-like enzyme